MAAAVPQTKIEVPVLPAGFVPRDGLRAEVDAGVAAAVGLVRAPAGFGKTVLVSHWAGGGPDGVADVAWVALDRDDDDPRRLWAAVTAALAHCPVVPPNSGLRRPRTWQPSAGPEFTAELLDDLARLPHPVRLVLDDLHLLRDPEALRGIDALVRNRPRTLRMVLASRTDPPLTLPRLRLGGRVFEIRADRMRFTAAETGALLRAAGVAPTADQVELLRRRTGGWAAGLRLAAQALADAPDVAAVLDGFSGDDPAVADYLASEVLEPLPVDVRRFLRAVSISDPVPAALATELTGREDAGHLLHDLEHRTSLVSRSTGEERTAAHPLAHPLADALAGAPEDESYRIEELLRSHLAADLARYGRRHAEDLHGRAARWWAEHGAPLPALEHAVHAADPGLTEDLLHRFAIGRFLAGDHHTLRRALRTVRTDDPWLALTSALTHLGVGELGAARGDLRRATAHWPAGHQADPAADPELTVLRVAAEELGAGPGSGLPLPCPTALPDRPELEALTRLGRGLRALTRSEDRTGARAELEAALALGRGHGFDYLEMQSLALLGFLAGAAGDVPSMSAIGDQAAVTASAHGWEDSPWSVAAQTMLAFAALHRCRPADAVRHADRGITMACAADPEGAGLRGGTGEALQPLWAALWTVGGAASFDQGDRAAGVARMRQARTELGDLPVVAEQAAMCAVLEFRAALALGHTVAARTVQGWLGERVPDCAELVLMRAWTDVAAGHLGHARALVAPLLTGAVPALLSHSPVEAWLVEATAAVAAGERPTARQALQSALALAEPLELLRPFAHVDPRVRDILALQLGSFGAADAFAQKALAVGACRPHVSALSERELTVLGLLPSMLSLDEIAVDLSVSVNTVKSHVRSIYTKLGVGSRRLAVLAAHEQGLLA